MDLHGRIEKELERRDFESCARDTKRSHNERAQTLAVLCGGFFCDAAFVPSSLARAHEMRVREAKKRRTYAVYVGKIDVFSITSLVWIERPLNGKTSKKQTFRVEKSTCGPSRGGSYEQVQAPKRLSRAAKREKGARSLAIFFEVSANKPVIAG